MTLFKKTKKGSRAVLAAACLLITSTAAAKNCSLSFAATPAAQTLQLTLAAPQHVMVGTLTQDCKKTSRYTLVVESANCPLSPAGAKLMNQLSGEFVRYSVEFDNKTTRGGIDVVAQLLAQNCAAQVARDEHSAYGLRRSDVFLDFTGALMLAEGTYSDTLSVTININ